MSKAKMHTPDFTEANIAKLADLFPSCVTEAKEENGILKRVVDFDRLRQELSDHVVDGPRERYHLDWPEKRKALLSANAPIAKTLRPMRKESVDFDSTRNLFIEGDNLDALKLVQETYLNAAKLIYIDPPYNTGSDLLYDDEFTSDSSEYLERSFQTDEYGSRLIANTESNGRFHSDWLSMMYPRLKLSKNLLARDGLVAVSIDGHEIHNLVHLCAEVFGQKNIVGIIANVNNPKGRSDDRFIATAHEYILLVAKDKTAARVHGFEPEDKVTRRYRKADNNGKIYREIDLRKTGDADRREDRQDMFYYFYFDEKKNILRVSKERNARPEEREIIPLRDDNTEGRWRWGFDTASKNLDALVPRYMPKRQIWGVFEKDYLDGRPPLKPTSAWTFKDVNSERGTEDFMAHGFAKEVFPRPKPLGTLRRILEFATLPGEDAFVFDLFAGSSSFAESVMQLTAETPRSIHYVAIQLAEPLLEEVKEHAAAIALCKSIDRPQNIAEIGKERIRRAGKKIKEESDLNGNQLDLGFRVLMVDSSNMKDVYYRPDAATQATLAGLVDNIKSDRNDEDLLFQVLLDWGVDLTLPIQKETINSKAVYFVDTNALAACFEMGIDEPFIKELAKRKPLRVVFRDAGYGSDATKINVEQIFKLLSPATEVKSL